MVDRLRRLDDAGLERTLAALAADIEFPATPDITAAVRTRLAAGRRPTADRRPSGASPPSLWERARVRVSPGRPSSVLRPVGLALAALVAILLAILVASPDARTAVADRLGLRGAGIFFIPAVPTATPVTGTPTPGARLDLGSRVTLAEARARVAYPVHVPALPDLGDPDEVYYVSVIPGGQVAFIYLPRPGLPAAAETGVAVLLTQFRGDTERDFILKGLGPGSRLEPVTVNGGSGYWIEGMPHLFLYRAADGQVHNETLRLAGNTLLWEQDGLLFRLESALSKDEALRIAGSVN